MSLIIDIATFRNYVKVNINSNIDTLKPAIAEAERRFIIPLIGKPLFDLLDTYVNDGGSDEDYEELLKQVEIPLANLAYWLHIPAGAVLMSDGGIHQLSNDNQKSASEARIEDLKESVAQAGFDALDNLLEFLEENKSEYTEWIDTPGYTVFHELFISTAKEFSIHYNINNSRRTFLALRHIIKHVQETHVKKVLGDDLYDEILEQLTDDGSSEALTDENQTLLNFIRPAMAYLTIADATAELPLDFRGNGIMLHSTESTMENARVIKPAELARLQTIETKSTQKGNDYLKRLELWLNANAADYPLYTAPSDDSSNTYFENKSTNKSYFT